MKTLTSWLVGGPVAAIVVSVSVALASDGKINAAHATSPDGYGPAAALNFARSYRGETYTPNVLHCFSDAKGVPFADCEHIIPMSQTLWTPRQIVADFQRRTEKLPGRTPKLHQKLQEILGKLTPQ